MRNDKHSGYNTIFTVLYHDPTTPATIVINEFMAHTDYDVPPHESNDWIELYNVSGSSIDLNGNWYLSDDLDELEKYALPTSSLAGNDWVSFDQVNHFNPDGLFCRPVKE